MRDLVDVNAVEAFYYSELVEGVCHVVLNLLFISSGNLFCGCSNEEVVDLAKDEDEALNRVSFPVEAGFVCRVVESHGVE